MTRTRPGQVEGAGTEQNCNSILAAQTYELRRTGLGELQPCVLTLASPSDPAGPIDVSGTSGYSGRMLHIVRNECRIAQRRAGSNVRRRIRSRPGAAPQVWAHHYPRTARGHPIPKLIRYRRLETLRRQSSTRLASTVLDNKLASKCPIDSDLIYEEFKHKCEAQDKFVT